MADPWRDEVQARLARYKTRRGRRIEGAFTMRFPFPPDEPAAAVAVSEAEEAPPFEHESIVAEEPSAGDLMGDAGEEDATAVPLVVAGTVNELEPAKAASEPEFHDLSSFALVAEPAVPATPVAEGIPALSRAPRPQVRRKVIAFPKSQTITEDMYRLADPVHSEQPRILDVPEELEAIPATPFLDGLLDASPTAAQNAASQRDHVELPFHAVKIARRIQATVVDLALVAVGTALFCGAAYKIMGHVVVTKSLLVGAVGVPALLWAVYQYLFLVYAGRTIGMQSAGLRLSSFKGCALRLRQRRSRVLGLYLSVLSLGMGVLWSLLDIDSLCWHDRISQTYPIAAD